MNCEKIMHAPEILMHQVHERKGLVHWTRTSIKIEVEVHYFVLILEHKVNTKLLM